MNGCRLKNSIYLAWHLPVCHQIQVQLIKVTPTISALPRILRMHPNSSGCGTYEEALNAYTTAESRPDELEPVLMTNWKMPCQILWSSEPAIPFI